MKILSLPNLVGHVVSILDDSTASQLTNARPSGMSKELYNRWCREATTKGHFISAWEGLNPQGRICENNPARYLHGIVADYDNANAISKIQALASSTGHLPTWVVQSFSPGKCRLIWPFESPVLVANPDITDEFLKKLDEKIKISHALPGFDKATWKENQYFELGSNWQQVTGAMPIPDSMLSECMLQGGMAAKMELADVEIPLEIVAEEVESRWPGRWGGQFTEGAAGPLFWVEPFLNHRNAVIRENGLVCFSDRAPSNFMPWRAILGDKFVEKYETERAARLAEMFFFDGVNYWTNTLNGGSWKPLNQNNAQLHLKNARCSPRVPKGSFVSEVEKVLVYIQSNRYVTAAVPMLFRDETLVGYNGADYLNISNKKALAPGDNGNPANFPWIYDFIVNGLDGDQDGIPAREFFIGWLRRFWMTSYQGDPQPGQSVILAGEAHTGKTFFSKCVLGVAVGGSITAEDLLLQRTKFNRQAAHNALWRCDDAIAEGDVRTKQVLANSLKAMAANPTVLYQPKFVDTTELPFLGRVFLTCNTDPESLKILPYLDGTIKDKLMMFRMKEGYRPHFFGNNGENEARAMAELPFFLRWLMDYPVNPAVIDPHSQRFEIASFHHKTLVAEANSEQPESLMAELIQAAMINLRGSTEKNQTLRLTTTELVRAIDNAELGRSLQQLGGVRTMGKLLHKVIEQKLSPYLLAPPKLVRGSNKYSFDPWVEGDENGDTGSL